MKAIILAGGRGERLKPLTDSIPKPMIEAAGKPILEHIISQMKKHGIKDFIIALYYLPKVITSYFGNGSKLGVNIQYTFENLPMGTAGAVLPSKKFIKETFIVTYADILRDLDITAMTAQHQKKKALATINIYKRKSRNAKSCVIFDNNGKVIKFVERPSKKKLKGKFIWANGSFYVFEPEIFSYIPQNKPSDFGKDIFPDVLTAKKSIYVYPSNDYFIDIGNKEKLSLARRTYLCSFG
ncbi:nucleotidyltransferase family protein [Candidatus Gottesmanbacteria bacterium]|nr:nucleotidyltransferase family protein [Candidatus Gottesmanbacteria bacterium]